MLAQLNPNNQAKSAFNTLHPFSRPDSLTRRGETFILRRALSPHELYGAIREWEETVKSLIPNVKIKKSTIDRKNQLRMWFQLPTGDAVMKAISVHVHTDTISVNRPFDAYQAFYSGQEVHPNEFWFTDLTDVRVFLQQKGIPVSVIFNGTEILNRSFNRPR